MKTKITIERITLIFIALGWLLFAFLSPQCYSEKHWIIHSIFFLLFMVIVILLFGTEKNEREELIKDNDLDRKVREDKAEEEKRNREQKRKLELEDKLAELKNK